MRGKVILIDCPAVIKIFKIHIRPDPIKKLEKQT